MGSAKNLVVMNYQSCEGTAVRKPLILSGHFVPLFTSYAPLMSSFAPLVSSFVPQFVPFKIFQYSYIYILHLGIFCKTSHLYVDILKHLKKVELSVFFFGFPGRKICFSDPDPDWFKQVCSTTWSVCASFQ